MKLTFLYHPVPRAADLPAAVAYYRERLGWSEAWREGSETVAFWLPDHSAQVMVSTTDQPAGPMFLVDSVGDWLDDHPEMAVGVPRYVIPGGSVVGLSAPAGYTFYVFDQPDA